MNLRPQNDFKKANEKWQLEKFISNPELELRVISLNFGSDPPDFEIKMIDKSISVEHTSLIHPSTKAQEAYNEQIVQLAKEKFESKYNEHLFVMVSLQNLKKEKKSKEKCAGHLYELIEKMYLANHNFNFDLSLKKGKSMDSFIHSIFLSNKIGINIWQHMGVHIVETIDFAWLLDNIQKKEKNLTKYVNNFNENWLLLVSNFGYKSSAYLYANLKNNTFNTKFDKVYIYKLMQDEIICIK